MNKRFALLSVQPFSLMLYFLTVIVFTSVCNNPVISLISFAVAAATYLKLKGTGGIKLCFFAFLLIIISALLNPLFSHNGSTELFFINSHAITFEAFFYGIYIGCIIAAVLLWCFSLSLIMDSERYLYILSHFFKKLSVVIMTALRFIPLFSDIMKNTAETNTVLYDCSKNKPPSNIKIFAASFSASVSQALMLSIETADAMKAKGWHGGKMTTVRYYKIGGSSVAITIFSVLFIILINAVFADISYKFSYFPFVSEIEFSSKNIICLVLCTAYMLIPIILEMAGDIKWQLLKSKI